MRPIASDYLESMLKLLLDLAVSVSGTKDSIQVEPIISTLANDHEIPRKISVQVMSWFGDLATGFWKVDELGIVKQLGLFILQKHKVRICFWFVSLAEIPKSTTPFARIG